MKFMFVIALSGKTRGHGLNSFSSCNFIYFLEDEGRFQAYFFNIVALRLHEHLGDSIVGLFLGGGGGGQIEPSKRPDKSIILLLVVNVPYFCSKVLIRFNTTLGRLKVRSNQMGTTPNPQVIGVIFNNIRLFFYLFQPLEKEISKSRS